MFLLYLCNMSNVIIYLNGVEPYLKQWFINEHGGNDPVNLVRGSAESNILKLFLKKRPDDVLPESPLPDALAIFAPSFKKQDPRTYNYLPHSAKVALHQCIKNRFDVQMWHDLHRFGNVGKQNDELVYAWMEAHGIELSERNWNAIVKRYQRKRNIYLTSVRRSDKNCTTSEQKNDDV